MTLAIVLLVAGLIVGGGIGYFAAPSKTVTISGSGTVSTVTQVVTQAPLKGQTIHIGEITSTTTTLETYKPLYQSMITPDANAYAKALGYNVTFVYNIDDAAGAPETHLEKVQGFRALGITCFSGGQWSSEAQASLAYVNTNDMLMWSSSSTSPQLAIAGDRLYRLCPADTALSPSLALVMSNWGIKDAIIIYRGDSWGDGIVNLLKPALAAKNIQLAGDPIRYTAETTEFSNFLQSGETQAKAAIAQYGAAHVGIVALEFDEAATISTEAKGFPNFYSLYCFGGDGTAFSTRLMQDATAGAVHQKFFSLEAAPPTSSKYTQVAQRYQALVNMQSSAYTAYEYDIGTTIFPGTMLQAQSGSADDVVALQSEFCNNTYGAGGWAKLNSYGDRQPATFSIVAYYMLPGSGVNATKLVIQDQTVGLMDFQAGTVTWNQKALGNVTVPGPGS